MRVCTKFTKGVVIPRAIHSFPCANTHTPTHMQWSSPKTVVGYTRGIIYATRIYGYANELGSIVPFIAKESVIQCPPLLKTLP